MVETGVIHGRFQVLHNDHMKYLAAGKARCHHLVVGITNPDPTLTREDPADPSRSHPAANPLTYFERYTLLRAALGEAGWQRETFSLVPFPINIPELYHHYLPLDAMFFLTLYDDWGRRKLERFQGLGLKTTVLWERPAAAKGLSGSLVRRLMASGGAWHLLVPPSTRPFLERWRIAERLCLLEAGNRAISGA
jgi:nicotinamide-nucleotide adenylyltransferase